MGNPNYRFDKCLAEHRTGDLVFVEDICPEAFPIWHTLLPLLPASVAPTLCRDKASEGLLVMRDKHASV